MNLNSLHSETRAPQVPPPGETRAAAWLLVLFVATLLAGTIALTVWRAASASTLYLPAVPQGRDWFDQSEFEGALSAAGYDVTAVTPLTWCELHRTAQPPAMLRYSMCALELTPDDDTDALRVMFWFDGVRMVWAMVGL